MKLVKTWETAEACVILRSGFANFGNWVFFADEEDAKKFAEENDGRVVDQDGLADKFESMHCAAGRDPRNDSHGRCIEDPDQADEIWSEQYAEDAKNAFENAKVYKIEDDIEIIESTLAEMAGRADCGILDKADAELACKELDKYREACRATKDNPDNCIAYSKLAQRVAEFE